MENVKVLLVEDDTQIQKSLKMNLSLSGYEVNTAETVAEAMAWIGKKNFDLYLLDVNLPDGNGLDLCHEIRAKSIESPVLFLSARTDEETVVKAMNIGAEDYIRKPFGVEELKARMKKASAHAPAVRNLVEAGPLTLDIGRRSADVAGKPLNLGRREFDILSALAKRAGDVVTRENIINYLGENPDIYDRTIDSHVSHLRRKLREAAGEAVQIAPVYGVGYKLQWIESK
jgi:DNA-binding response OmpR family regulator